MIFKYGQRFILLARWAAAVDGRDLALWLDTPYYADARTLRGLLWAVEFRADSGQGPSR